ncbi:7SK snRNA methylphosphate capping enzyme [Lampris incognitus]|uniref:7SK snRNA methylphosphate capping enzyme n=1 Tax=Lampris incognitus TaxID=2546036 RepID=UPI0024B62B95|nr:7SK snRNA methylphosphate capping enzyme [Lampris incognitus]
MSVDEEAVKTANSTLSLQILECTGAYNNISIMAEVPVATPDNSENTATCPVPHGVDLPNHESSADTCALSESVGEKASENENHINRRSSLHHSKQQQQQRLTKRRNTSNSSFKHPTSGKRRRRANSESDSVLPTNFLLGGNIFDPLNLNSLLDEEVNRTLNAETPKSSPLPAKSRDPVEILIPRDITDPLNLNSGITDSSFLTSPFKSSGRRRHRRHHGGGGGGSGVGGGISVSQVDLSDSRKRDEVKTSATTLPPAMSVSVLVSDVPGESSTFSGVPVRDSEDSKECNLASCKELLTAVLSGPNTLTRITEDFASSTTGGSNQHSSRRKRRRNSGKMEPSVAQSTPAGKPGSADRVSAMGSSRISQCFGTPKSGPRVWQGSQQQQPCKRQQRKKFQYGNYNKYYGYRNPGAGEDARVRYFRPEWFEGKDVLDLGCNTGYLTLYIAKVLRPASILGLDIDSDLIYAARKNIRHYLSELQTREARWAMKGEKSFTQGGRNGEASQTGRKGGQDKHNEAESRYENGKPVEGDSCPAEAVNDSIPCRVDEAGAVGKEIKVEEIEKEDCENPSDHPVSCSFPVSFRISRGPIAAPPLPDTPAARRGEFPSNVSFIRANYILENDNLLLTQYPEYDVVMCLSVTKWVHLNWGDCGIKQLFQRVYRHLRPGGLFILEPQPWESYYRRRKLTDNILKNYKGIRLKPDQFSAYLTNEVGFSSYELIGTPKCSFRGFQRPLYLFNK